MFRWKSDEPKARSADRHLIFFVRRARLAMSEGRAALEEMRSGKTLPAMLCGVTSRCYRELRLWKSASSLPDSTPAAPKKKEKGKIADKQKRIAGKQTRPLLLSGLPGSLFGCTRRCLFGSLRSRVEASGT